MKFVEIDGDNVDFWRFWSLLIKSAPFHHSLYTQSGIRLIENYNIEQRPFSNLSLIIVDNGLPYVGILMTIHESDEINVLSCYGFDLYYKENPCGDFSILKNARVYIKRYIERVIEENNIKEVHHRDFDSIDGRASNIGKLLLDKGAVSYLDFMQLCDLSMNLDFVYSGFSKSCRNNINRSLKQNDFKIVTNENVTWESIYRLKSLHFLASGRKTRNDASWEDLFFMVELNEAFIIEAYRRKECIASALFFFTETTVIYGIAAADRGLFKDPINHGLIWKAVQFAAAAGCRYFELGSLSYQDAGHRVEQKNFNINRFKKNFGGSTVYQLKTKLVL